MPVRNFCIELSEISSTFGTKRQVIRLLSLAPCLKSKHSLKQCNCSFMGHQYQANSSSWRSPALGSFCSNGGIPQMLEEQADRKLMKFTGFAPGMKQLQAALTVQGAALQNRTCESPQRNRSELHAFRAMMATCPAATPARVPQVCQGQLQVGSRAAPF